MNYSMTKASACASCNEPSYGKREGKACCRLCLTFSFHKWESALEESQRIREASHGESLLDKAIARHNVLPTDTSNTNFWVALLRRTDLPDWLVAVTLGYAFSGEIPASVSHEYYLFKQHYLVR